jgi:hypothetical protein
MSPDAREPRRNNPARDRKVRQEVPAVPIVTALSLTLALTAQDPRWSADWARDGADPARPAAVVVTGSPELGVQEAVQSALDRATEQERQRTADRIDAWYLEQAPAWVPGFVVERAARSARRRLGSPQVQVLDRDLLVRDFGYGPIHQAALLVHVHGQPRDSIRRAADSALGRELKLLGIKGGGILVFWALLALAGSWLDRLTRGYMTWRLRAIGLLLGGLVPIAALCC